MNRTERIKIKLAVLKPDHLEIIDESEGHRGHFDSAGEEGTHLKVIISSPSLTGGNILKNHRIINKLLAAEFQEGLHALKIKILEVG